MRKTLASIGALSLTALSFAYCSSDNNTGGTLDMAMPNADLTSTGSEPDLSTTADQSTTTPDQSTGDMPSTAAPTEFMVLRIGADNRATALTNDATAGFLERRKFSDGTLVGNVIPLPTTLVDGNYQLTFSGVGSVEGQLTRSIDGKYVVVAGYAAPVNMNNVPNSTVRRVIGRIDNTNTVNTKTAFNDFSGLGVRGAATTDGTALWVSTSSGIGYAPFGQLDTLTKINSTANVRGLGIMTIANSNGAIVTQLVASGDASGTYGLNTVGDGTPTALGTATLKTVPGFTQALSPGAYGFTAFDTDATPGVDLIYVADDTTVGTGGVRRWKLNGATWMYEGNISLGATIGARGVAGYLTTNGATKTVTLVATTTEAPTRIIRLTDNLGLTATVAQLDLVAAKSKDNNVYRGISLPPQ